jgi:ElaB/YqjD/DUF883 family membrane-anchored ribosome-binding protein
MNEPKQVTQTAADIAEEVGQRGKRAFDDFSRRAGETMREYRERARQRADELRENSETYIRDNPWTSMVGALALGLVVGLIIGSRRS